MRLLTFSAGGQSGVGLEVAGYVVDLAAGFAVLNNRAPTGLPTPPKDMRSFLEAGAPAWDAAALVNDFITDSLAHGRKVGFEGQPRTLYEKREVTILAPIANPHKMLFLGLNYADHAAETGKAITSVPTIFAKFDNAIIGPGEPIVLPKAAPDHVDLEAELAVVIGRPAKHVAIEDAFSYVAGYTVINDVSARDLQGQQTQWVMGKTPDTFAPMGPHIVTAEEVPDPHSLAVRSWLNGQLMQDSNTSNLIFNIPFLVHHISQFVTLVPGDIIATGTPPGVGYVRKPPIYLRPGDVVRVEVEGVGVLENPVVAER
ncbi:MAG: fumarylacetoacetate hydrolase family protein [Chloroflexota bacterium]